MATKSGVVFHWYRIGKLRGFRAHSDFQALGQVGKLGSSKRTRVFDFYPLEDRILLSGEGLDGAEMSVDADPDFAASLMEK